MSTLINIGLTARSTAIDVLLALAASDLRAVEGAQFGNTLVVRLANEGTRYLGPAVRDLAHALGRDCIALHTTGNWSVLVGDRAAAYGPFNPTEFLTLDGSPLEAKRGAKSTPHPDLAFVLVYLLGIAAVYLDLFVWRTAS